MGQAEQEGRRVRVGEVDEVRSRRWVFEVERQEVRRGEGPSGVGVGEDHVATRGKLPDRMQGLWDALPVVIVDVKRLDNAVHGDGRRLVEALYEAVG